MTKSTITRERIAQIANPDAWVKCTHEEVQELARMALAAMDSDPVAEITEDLGRLFVKIHHPTALKAGDNLYLHAQPVVSDGLVKAVEFYEQVKRENPPVETGAWKDAVDWVLKEACRAATLHAGNSPAQSDCCPAQNHVSPEQNGDTPAQRHGWIPVSEQMPPSRHEVLVGRWWGEKPRWCCKWATYIPCHPDAQSSGWLIPGASWMPTHWMELPAAPQEVKGE